jgi:hypothetical protein
MSCRQPDLAGPDVPSCVGAVELRDPGSHAWRSELRDPLLVTPVGVAAPGPCAQISRHSDSIRAPAHAGTSLSSR